MARARYVRYSLAFKLRAIKFAESNSNNKASKRFKVSHKQIRKWIENKQKMNEYLAQNNINKIHIPKRFTNLLQPADVSWMRPLKRAYHERWQNWLINEERTFTPAGNIRSPGYTQVITWISEIWEQLDAGIIRDSFDRCGITSSQFFDFHSQLQAFLEKNQIDMIDDYDHADEVDGFVDDVNTNLVDSDSDSNSGSEGDSDIE